MAKIESGPSVDSRKIKSSLAVIVHGMFETLTVGLSATTPILGGSRVSQTSSDDDPREVKSVPGKD